MTQQVTANRMADNGEFGIQQTNREAMVEVASTRAAQEIQSAMIIAKKFPRDEIQATNRILTACKRKTLAEQALYAYPKGGQTVTGPSIRLAEMLAQNWQNVDFGIVELEQRDGESTVMSYAWDLETNTRQTKIFTVRHERYTRKGAYALNDPREIYELTANQGARRLRACILGVIPGDVVDAAVAECEKTMAGNNAEPLVDRIRKMIAAFAELQVTQDMIEARVGHKCEVISEAELVGLKKIYRSLRDNMADRADFFNVGGAVEETTNLDERLKQAAAKKNGGAQQSHAEADDLPAQEPAAPDEDQRQPELPPVPETEEALVDAVANLCGIDMDAAAKKLKVQFTKGWAKTSAQTRAAWWTRFLTGNVVGLVPTKPLEK